MKPRIFVFLFLILVGFLAVTESTDAQTRIRFARGAVRANVSGVLNSYQSKRTYVIRVRAGQTLKTEQRGSNQRPVTISIKDPNGNDVGDADASCNDRKELSPTVAGDYLIAVIECRKADPWRGSFTFRVTVR